ncbi:MAG: hypothetical protein QT03_C0001G0732 [archaeon GW2011_AR10]|nr:MAG: hypothetical protein QT03_C0001G0732 [archaeon GW2011_AR10]
MIFVQVFETKLRKVGSSWGALIPKEVVKQEKIGEGEKIQLAVIKKDISLLEKAFGSVKNAKPFRRDHKDRVF